MRVDKIEFGESLHAKPELWSKEDDDFLNRNSSIRVIGERVLDHIDGRPIISPPHDSYVLTSQMTGSMMKTRVDGDHCVLSRWTRLSADAPFSKSWVTPIPVIEDAFFVNSLTFSRLETHHISSVEDIPSLKVGHPEEPKSLLQILCPSTVKTAMPKWVSQHGRVGITILGEDYLLHTLNVPLSHPYNILNQGYILEMGSIRYDVSEMNVSDDMRSFQWNIRMIISDPDSVHRIVFPECSSKC